MTQIFNDRNGIKKSRFWYSIDYTHYNILFPQDLCGLIVEEIGTPSSFAAARSSNLWVMSLRLLSKVLLYHSPDVPVPVWLFTVFPLALTVHARAPGIWLSCPPRLFDPAFPLFAVTFSRSAHLPRVTFPFLTHFLRRGRLPTEPKITSTSNTAGRILGKQDAEVLHK